MNARVTVVGSLNMDLVTQAKIPVRGETVLGGDLATIPGGKGANQAVAAARLGAKVAMVGRVGDDVFASRLIDNLAADGINTDYVCSTADTASGVALIVVDDEGQNIIVVASAANFRVTPQDVERAEPVIAAADVMLLQLEIPLDAIIRAAQLAAANDVRIILNPAPAHPLPDELLRLVDVLIPNETETSILTGLPVDSPEQRQAAAAQLLGVGVDTVILTLGAQGALLMTQGNTRHFPAIAVENVVDTTAAGDAFVGGLATALALGKPLDEAIAWGNGAGGLSVTRAGAQPSLPTLDELRGLLGNSL